MTEVTEPVVTMFCTVDTRILPLEIPVESLEDKTTAPPLAAFELPADTSTLPGVPLCVDDAVTEIDPLPIAAAAPDVPATRRTFPDCPVAVFPLATVTEPTCTPLEEEVPKRAPPLPVAPLPVLD